MKQVYILPTPQGWAVNVYGDEVVPDGAVVPLPLTRAVAYDEVEAFVRSTPMGRDAMVDGWASPEQLAELEPALAAEVSDHEQAEQVARMLTGRDCQCGRLARCPRHDLPRRARRPLAFA